MSHCDTINSARPILQIDMLILQVMTHISRLHLVTLEFLEFLSVVSQSLPDDCLSYSTVIPLAKVCQTMYYRHLTLTMWYLWHERQSSQFMFNLLCPNVLAHHLGFVDGKGKPFWKLETIHVITVSPHSQLVIR